MLKIVSECQRKAFGYDGNKTWTTGMGGIQISKEGIQMLKIVSECQRKAFEYTGECGIRMLKEASGYTWRLSGY